MFGLSDRPKRFAEIALRHARHNPFRFVVTGSDRPADYDIAVVDMTARGGPETAASLRNGPEVRPVITVGRRTDSNRPRDDVLQQALTMQLLPKLNAVVEGGMMHGQEAHAAPSAGPTARHRPRTLIVDDNPTARRQLGMAMQHIGADCETVGSANEALSVLGMREYDVVIVDSALREFDGFKLAREIKKRPDWAELQVVVLALSSSPFELARGALAGCDSFLVKPVSLQTLRETVFKLAAKHHYAN